MNSKRNGFKRLNTFWDSLRPDFPYLLTIGVVFFLIVLTNAPGLNQWLSGWDNLHPEFNFPLNAARAIAGVWQEFQGVGLIGGHGYAATLPHTLFLWILSAVIPVNMLRSLFTFLMLLVGSLGTFYLTKKFLSGIKRQDSRDTTIQAASLCASLFAMLNLGTMQNFTIQLEAFIIHFGLLPWLILSLWQVLEHPDKKSYFLFILANIAIIPAGFIPPLFVVQVLIISVYLLFYLLTKRTVRMVKKSLFVVAIITCINAFWLLPLAHFTVRNSGDYLTAYNNLQSTEDFILRNQKYGDIFDVALIKGFLFEAKDVNTKGDTVPLLSPWIAHLSQPLVLMIGYAGFAVVLVGLTELFLIRKNPITVGSILLFFTFLLFLATSTPPFSWITTWLQQISPIFEQAFRVAFTKFSIAFALYYALFFGTGAYLITELIRSKFRLYIFTIFLAALLYYALPAFNGYFIYPRIRLTIPAAYFQLFEYMKTQNPEARIMNLPQGWNWGWTPYDWGYSGSGFLWYGIRQPIMDRAFDVWSKYNENYYWELIHALFAKDYRQFESLLAKYDITWVLFDPTVIPYQQNRRVFELMETERYLNTSDRLHLTKTFGELKLYRVSKDAAEHSYLSFLSHPLNIAPQYHWTNYDQATQQLSQYMSDPSLAADVYYPYRTLFGERMPEETEFFVSKSADGYIFSSGTIKDSIGGKMSIPDLTKTERYIPVELRLTPVTNRKYTLQATVRPYEIPSLVTAVPTVNIWSLTAPDNGPLTVYFNGALISSINQNDQIFQRTVLASLLTKNYIDITTTDNNHILGEEFIPSTGLVQQTIDTPPTHLSVTIPFSYGNTSYNSDDDPNFYNHRTNTCDKLLTSPQPVLNRNNGKALIFNSTESSQCFDIILPQIPQNTGYLVEIDSEHEIGKGISFNVVNTQTKKNDIEVTLPKGLKRGISYIVIPPMQTDGLGYSLQFINSSLNTNPSVNYLYHVRMTPIPFYWLTGIHMGIVSRLDSPAKSLPISNVSHTGTWLFRADMSIQSGDRPTIVLSQGFHKDWIALMRVPYFPYVKHAGSHILVNNWENGWVLDKTKSTTTTKMTNITDTTNGNSTIIIFFWPQLLEWAGFLLLPIPFLFLLRKNR